MVHLLVKVLIVLCFFSLTSCVDLFDYSPYEVRVEPKNRQWNQKQIERLEEQSEFEPFRILFISDTHTEYDNFIDFVSIANSMTDIAFIVNGGDVSLSGISKEFDWYQEIIKKLDVPIVTVIGNHDYLSNGLEVYKTMFGKTNFTFVYNNCKFVIFDDIIWENPKGEVDYKWIDTALENDSNYTHVIPFSHIPPWDEQLDYANYRMLHYIITKNSISKSFHGHVHQFMSRYLFEDSTEYVCTPGMKKRGFLILSISVDSIVYEQISF